MRWLQATRVQLAHSRARHRRARAVGVRRRGGSRRQAVPRNSLSPYPVPAARDRPSRRDRHAGDAGDGARVSRPTRSFAASRRSSCAATRCWWRPSCKREARSRSRCPPVPGTTSFRGSASPASRVLRSKRGARSVPECSVARDTRWTWASWSSTPARSIPAKPLEQLWAFGKLMLLFQGYLQANVVEASDGTYAIGAVADVKVELFGDAARHRRRQAPGVARALRSTKVLL